MQHMARVVKEDLFSSVSLSDDCLDGHCQVPAGHTWILDESVDVKSLELVWNAFMSILHR